jgi:hypothetical protein
MTHHGHIRQQADFLSLARGEETLSELRNIHQLPRVSYTPSLCLIWEDSRGSLRRSYDRRSGFSEILIAVETVIRIRR